MIGKHVLVRTESAGVHVGTLAWREGQEVILHNARRIWSWEGAFTLSAVSQYGLNPKASRMTVTVPEILLLEAIEVIPTSAAARATYDASEERRERA